MYFSYICVINFNNYICYIQIFKEKEYNFFQQNEKIIIIKFLKFEGSIEYLVFIYFFFGFIFKKFMFKIIFIFRIGYL